MSGELIVSLAGKVPQRALRHLSALPYVASYEIEENQTLLGVDFGGSDSTYIIQTPETLRAKPIEVSLYDISENFAATTKSAVLIGDGSDADEFALTGNFVDAEMTTSVGAKNYSAHAGSLVVGDNEIIQPDDLVTITCRAGVTGPTGICRVSVTFLYFV